MRKKKPPVFLEDVPIEAYAAEGKCIARWEGKVVFVEGAVPQDHVDLRLTRNKKDWAEATLISLRKASPFRVEPACSHFGVCGGCQWQMLSYDQQLRFKQQQVQDALSRIAKIPLPALSPIVGADQTFEYRNKIEYTFANRRFLSREELLDPSVRAESPVAGFHAKGFFDKVVDIRTCLLQQEPSNQIRETIKRWALERGKTFYDLRVHQGWLRTLQLRICRTGEIMVNVVFGYEQAESRQQLLEHLLEKFPSITTLLYTINTKRNDSLVDQEPVVYQGPGFVREQLEEFSFKIGPKSFFQTNTRQAEKLYQWTREFCGLSGDQVLYDLYCGTGSIGIFCSRQAKAVIGVESVGEAVRDARENARLNAVTHARFFEGDAARICTPEFFAAQGTPDVVVTDPPRAGMHEDLLRALLQIQAPTLVYVSCNPATQARDLQILDGQYSVSRIQPVDMFPHTHHIENIVQLKLRSPATRP